MSRIEGLRDFLFSFRESIVDIGTFEEPNQEVTKRALMHEESGSIVMFRVKGIEWSLVAGVLATRSRLYRLLGVESDEQAYLKVLNACSAPSKPREVSFHSFFKEVSIDLDKAPFIKFFPYDGGRYLTSSIYVACIDDLCNASIHRTMLIGKREVVARIVPRHLEEIRRRYLAKGMETPVAIVVGAHPIYMLAASLSPPLGVFEFDVAASLGNAVVAYTPQYSIPVPVPAAIVMEGRITRELVNEGPFADLLKTYDRVRKQPLIKIDRIYVGEDLANIIIPTGAEHRLLQSFYREALIWDSARRVVPRVHKVRLTPGGGSWLHAVISVDKLHDGDAKNVIAAAFAAHPSLKLVVVVDGDVDPDDYRQVEWAIATRFQAHRGLVVIPHARCSTLDPSSDDGLCTKLGIDATAPLANRERYRRAEV